ncbi:hypothetical protein D3C85_1911140 [compost metagenome]
MLIPMGKDKVTSALMVFFSIVSILVATLLSIWFGVNGVVVGFVITEFCLFVALTVSAVGVTLKSKGRVML